MKFAKTVSLVLLALLLASPAFFFRQVEAMESLSGVSAKKVEGFLFDEATGTILGEDPDRTLLAELTIPESLGGKAVYQIGEGAFRQKNVRTVTFPASLQRIGKEAFAHCKKLQKISFAASSQLESIGEGAFKLSTLEEVALPEKLQSIEAEAFESTKLKEIRLPKSLQDLGERAFRECRSLTRLDLDPEAELEQIGAYAFSFAKLQRISFPRRLRTIGNNAFVACPFQEVHFAADAQLETIGKAAFDSPALKSLSLPASLRVLDEGALTNCSQLEEVHFPPDSKLERIAKGAFQDLPLKKVELPASLKVIEADAFFNCEQLQSIHFPENAQLEEIGHHALARTGLQELTLPASLKKVDREIFEPGFNRELKSITLLAGRDEAPYAADAPWGGPRTAKVYYRGGDIRFEKKILPTETPYERKIHIRASIDPAKGQIQKVILPDGNELTVEAATWPKEGDFYQYPVQQNGRYTFQVIQPDGSAQKEVVLVDDIGQPKLLAHPLKMELAKIQALTKEQLLQLLRVKAVDETGRDLHEHVLLADTEVDAVKALRQVGQSHDVLLQLTHPQSGKKVEERVKVEVIAKNHPPVLKVADGQIQVTDVYDLTLLIQEARDEEDGDDLKDLVEINADSFDPTKPGKYQVLYALKDSGGLVAYKDVWVTVLPAPLPLNHAPILLVEDKTLTVGENLDLKSLILRAEDAEDGPNLQDQVLIEQGTFDPTKEGKYEIIFTLRDQAGASTRKSAMVTVVKKQVLPNPPQPPAGPALPFVPREEREEQKALPQQKKVKDPGIPQTGEQASHPEIPLLLLGLSLTLLAWSRRSCAEEQ